MLFYTVMTIDKSWTTLRVCNCREFFYGLIAFLDRCQEHLNSYGKSRCPCENCDNHTIVVVMNLINLRLYFVKRHDFQSLCLLSCFLYIIMLVICYLSCICIDLFQGSVRIYIYFFTDGKYIKACMVEKRTHSIDTRMYVVFISKSQL